MAENANAEKRLATMVPHLDLISFVTQFRLSFFFLTYVVDLFFNSGWGRGEMLTIMIINSTTEP